MLGNNGVIDLPQSAVAAAGRPPAPGGRLPAAVHVHYLKALLDWSVSQLVRQQPQKRTKQADGIPPPSAAPQPHSPPTHPRLDPASWDLLSSLLVGDWGGAAVAAAVPPSILVSAAAACQSACSSGETEGDGEAAESNRPALLLRSVNQCLRLLLRLSPLPDINGSSIRPSKGIDNVTGPHPPASQLSSSLGPSSSSSFHPSLEQCVALTLDVIGAHAYGTEWVGSKAAGNHLNLYWTGLVLTSVEALHGLVLRHPNTKKVG